MDCRGRERAGLLLLKTTFLFFPFVRGETVAVFPFLFRFAGFFLLSRFSERGATGARLPSTRVPITWEVPFVVVARGRR